MTLDLFNSADADAALASDIEALKTRYTKEDGSVDFDGLVRAKAHADSHIKKVETERAGLYEDLKTRSTLEELLARQTAANNNVNHEPQINSTATPLSEKDVDAKLDAKLNAYKKQLTYEQNIEFVKNELTKMWGSDYPVKLKAKARELGVTEDELAWDAQTRPKIFLKIVSEGERSIYNPAPPSTSHRTLAVPHSQQGKGYKDFSKLRRENPSAYWSVATQKEMHKLMEEYAARGEDFTKT